MRFALFLPSHSTIKLYWHFHHFYVDHLHAIYIRSAITWSIQLMLWIWWSTTHKHTKPKTAQHFLSQNLKDLLNSANFRQTTVHAKNNVMHGEKWGCGSPHKVLRKVKSKRRLRKSHQYACLRVLSIFISAQKQFQLFVKHFCFILPLILCITITFVENKNCCDFLNIRLDLTFRNSLCGEPQSHCSLGAEKHFHFKTHMQINYSLILTLSLSVCGIHRYFYRL